MESKSLASLHPLRSTKELKTLVTAKFISGPLDELRQLLLSTAVNVTKYGPEVETAAHRLRSPPGTGLLVLVASVRVMDDAVIVGATLFITKLEFEPWMVDVATRPWLSFTYTNALYVLSWDGMIIGVVVAGFDAVRVDVAQVPPTPQ